MALLIDLEIGNSKRGTTLTPSQKESPLFLPPKKRHHSCSLPKRGSTLSSSQKEGALLLFSKKMNHSCSLPKVASLLLLPKNRHRHCSIPIRGTTLAPTHKETPLLLPPEKRHHSCSLPQRITILAPSQKKASLLLPPKKKYHSHSLPKRRHMSCSLPKRGTTLWIHFLYLYFEFQLFRSIGSATSIIWYFLGALGWLRVVKLIFFSLFSCEFIFYTYILNFNSLGIFRGPAVVKNDFFPVWLNFLYLYF